MALIVQPMQPERLTWFCEKTSCVRRDLTVIEAIDSEGKVQGAIGCTDESFPNAVQLHLVLEKPIALRRLLPAIFAHIFEKRGKGVALVSLPSSEPYKRTLKLAEGVGFHEACRIRDAFARGVDLVVMEMHREDCRWLQHPSDKGHHQPEREQCAADAGQREPEVDGASNAFRHPGSELVCRVLH